MWLKISIILVFYLVSAFASSPRDLSDVVAAAPSDPEGISFRLPNNTIPIHYDIYISTDIHIPRLYFNGSIFITIRTLMPSTNITVNFKQLNVFAVHLFRSDWSLVENYVNFVANEETELLVITPTDELPGGQEFNVGINYNGLLRDDMYGFYHAFYIDEEGNKKYYAMTQFQPTDARHAFPW